MNLLTEMRAQRSARIRATLIYLGQTVALAVVFYALLMAAMLLVGE